MAVLICSNVVGGHEFQAAALVRELSRHVYVTVFVNLADQRPMFESPGVEVLLLNQQLLRPGMLPRQVLDGLARRGALRAAVREHDHVIVSAGAVEAGVAAGIALWGMVPASVYLPSFHDRVSAWGLFAGHAYNLLLRACSRLFSRVITINRIQAKVIGAFTGRPTVVVNNAIRSVAAPVARRAGRLLFIGRLDPQKRVGELLEWLDFPANPFEEIMIIGDGPVRAELESQGRKLSHLRCEFFGWMDAAAQDALISANDILLLNSMSEGEPLVIREAKLRRMRVFSRDILGTRGVTSRASRFDSKDELRHLISQQSTMHEEPSPPRLSHPLERLADNERRQRQVARLAALIELTCSAATRSARI